MLLTKCLLMNFALSLMGGAVIASNPEPTVCFDMNAEAENFKQFKMLEDARDKGYMVVQSESSDFEAEGAEYSLSPFINLINDCEGGVDEILESVKTHNDLDEAMLDRMVTMMVEIQGNMHRFGVYERLGMAGYPIPAYKSQWSRNYALAYENQQNALAARKK